MSARRPNILHLCTDGQRFDTVAALGNPVIQTPNLDRLANEGVAFTNAYTPTAMCTPARASMLYGRYPYRQPERIWPEEDGADSFVDELATAGYRTHSIGKRDFPRLSERRGFQTFDAHEELMDTASNDDYLVALQAAGFDHLVDPEGVRGELYYLPQPAQMPAPLHASAWVADRALGFIGEQDDDAPWYLFCSWTGPRPPVSVPSPWYKLYRTLQMPPPNVPADNETMLTHINRVQNRYKFRDQGIDRHAVRSLKAFYYAAVSFIDYQIGRITAALEAAGQLDDTLIVFHSDHGELLGDYDSFGPRSFHDAASRIPMIVRYPGRFEGGERDERMASLVDVAPTMLAAAGVEAATGDGLDLAADPRHEYVTNWYRHELGFMVEGMENRPQPPNELFSRVRNSVYTIVEPGLKYTYSAADDREFLIDRRTDPDETRNAAGNPFHAADLARLRATLIADLTDAGFEEGIDGVSWRRFEPLQLGAAADPADAGMLMQDQAWASVDLPGYEAPPLQVDPIGATDTDDG